jgi:hypothetical protein
MMIHQPKYRELANGQAKPVDGEADMGRQLLELRGGSRSTQPPLNDQRKCNVTSGEGPARDKWLVETRRFHQERKWIEPKLIRKIMSEETEPTILRDIGELFALLWTLMFEPKDILKMMDHLMYQNRKLDRCFALPALRQIDSVCGVIVEGERIALGRCCLIVGGNPSSGRREQCFEAQCCHLPCRHEPQNRILTDRRKIEFGRKPGCNHRKQSLTRGIAGVSKVRLRPDLSAVNFGSCDRWKSCRLFGVSDGAIVIVRSANADNDAFHMT